MLASLRNGHAKLARLASRPLVARQVRAKTTAKATAKTAVKRTRKAAEEAADRTQDAMKDATKLPAPRIAETAAKEDGKAKTTAKSTRKKVATNDEKTESTAKSTSKTTSTRSTKAPGKAASAADRTQDAAKGLTKRMAPRVAKVAAAESRETQATESKIAQPTNDKPESKTAGSTAEKTESKMTEPTEKKAKRKASKSTSKKTFSKSARSTKKQQAEADRKAHEKLQKAERRREQEATKKDEEEVKADRKRQTAMLKAKGPVARKLDATAIWDRGRGRKGPDAQRALDPRRVNIVSSELCDSIVEMLGPSLERHRGCDLVDLNPGAGLWSQKLHALLEPRKHILMDLDAELYKPYLSELLDRDNVELVPKSGIVWRDLHDMMRTHLPGQTERDKDSVPTRNDTLLVTANLAMFPKKTFHGFESVSTMVLYQLLSSIRTSSLFQKYGLVRMLVWINDEDKKRILPRALARRRRSAFEAEMSCEWIHEVAGVDAPEDRCSLRDGWLNVESALRTVERMKAQGLTMPAARATRAYRECMQTPELMGQALAGVRPPTLQRPFKAELEMLELGHQRGASNNVLSQRLKILRARDKLAHAEALQYLEFLQQFRDVSRLAASSPSEFKAADAQWNERLGSLKKNMRVEFKGIKDNYMLFRQDPPAMLWDRRATEPLNVFATDFFPNAPTALLDIQPKATRPVFRQYGPATSRSGDMSDVMLRFWYQHTLAPIQKAMDGLWGGFGDLVSRCPSLADPDRGGSPVTCHGSLVSRGMNEEQWAEIVQAWMDWPFRPTYVQMLARMLEEVDADTDDDDGKSGALGVQF